VSGVSSWYHFSLGAKPKPSRFHDRVWPRTHPPGSNSHRDRRDCHEPNLIWMVPVSRLLHCKLERNAEGSTHEHAILELNRSAAGARINSIDRAKRRWLCSCQPKRQHNETHDCKRGRHSPAQGHEGSWLAASNHNRNERNCSNDVGVESRKRVPRELKHRLNLLLMLMPAMARRQTFDSNGSRSATERYSD
jgi:hypothetical protein